MINFTIRCPRFRGTTSAASAATAAVARPLATQTIPVPPRFPLNALRATRLEPLHLEDLDRNLPECPATSVSTLPNGLQVFEGGECILSR